MERSCIASVVMDLDDFESNSESEMIGKGTPLRRYKSAIVNKRAKPNMRKTFCEPSCAFFDVTARSGPRNVKPLLLLDY
jgi:hypothetical protein